MNAYVSGRTEMGLVMKKGRVKCSKVFNWDFPGT